MTLLENNNTYESRRARVSELAALSGVHLLAGGVLAAGFETAPREDPSSPWLDSALRQKAPSKRSTLCDGLHSGARGRSRMARQGQRRALNVLGEGNGPEKVETTRGRSVNSKMNGKAQNQTAGTCLDGIFACECVVTFNQLEMPKQPKPREIPHEIHRYCCRQSRVHRFPHPNQDKKSRLKVRA